KGDPSGRTGPVQRLDAESVACENELPTVGIPDGEPEHAAKVLYAIDVILFIKVHDRFGVRTTGERVSTLLQVPPQLTEVVDLTVRDHMHRPVLIAHRLS